MDLKDLRIFARVAALQNLTAVATALGTTAGTVSKRIQALEEQLGVRLLDRTTRSVRLTEEGRMFLGRAERIVAELELAQDELSANSGHPAGRLAISVPTSLAHRLVYPAITSFASAFPAVEIRVDITDRVSNLHEEGYDVAIRTGSLPDSTLKAKRLAADQMILAAAPAYLQERGTPETPADLTDHECLIHSDCRTWQFYRDGRAETVAVTGRFASDSGEFLRRAAIEGLGILRSSASALTNDLQKGRLVRVLPEHELAKDAAIWAVYPNAKHAMPRLRAFLDHLGEYCRKHCGDGTPAAPLQNAIAVSRPADNDVEPKRLAI